MLPRQPKHECMAVEAGIHVFAISAGRIFQHFEIGFSDIFHNQRNILLTGGMLGLIRGKKRGFKCNIMHVNALLLKHGA